MRILRQRCNPETAAAVASPASSKPCEHAARESKATISRLSGPRELPASNCRRCCALSIMGLVRAPGQRGRHPSRRDARRHPARERHSGTSPVERLPRDFDSLGVLRFSLFPG